MTRSARFLSTLVVAAMSFAIMPVAHAGSAEVTCLDGDGTVVLKIKANAHSERGLRKMTEMTSMAQRRLGVSCEVTTGSETTRVRNKVRVVCENPAGHVLTRVRADRRAMKGLETSVKAFIRVAGVRLHLDCAVVE